MPQKFFAAPADRPRSFSLRAHFSRAQWFTLPLVFAPRSLVTSYLPLSSRALSVTLTVRFCQLHRSLRFSSCLPVLLFIRRLLHTSHTRTHARTYFLFSHFFLARRLGSASYLPDFITFTFPPCTFVLHSPQSCDRLLILYCSFSSFCTWRARCIHFFPLSGIDLVMLLGLTRFNFFHVFSFFSLLRALSNLFLLATCSPPWFLQLRVSAVFIISLCPF